MSELIKNYLWNVVSNSSVYSFEDNPLPIFRELALHYVRISFFSKNVSTKENDDTDLLSSIIEHFQDKNVDLSIIDAVKKLVLDDHFQGSEIWKDFIFYDVMEELSYDYKNENTRQILGLFSYMLRNEVDKALLTEIVDFFTEKYVTLHPQKCLPYNFSKDFVAFIRRLADKEEEGDSELALYNPYAGISLLGIDHLEVIKCLINDFDDDPEEREFIIEGCRERAYYYGVESDPVLRFIGNVGLLVRTPENWDRTHVHSGDPMNDDINDFTGGWTFLATPPLNSYTEAVESDIKLISNLIDKFSEAKGMYCGLFLLPKFFCYDTSYEATRRKMVCSGMLNTVIELPKTVSNFYHDTVLVCLCKSTYECGIRIFDGAAYMKDGSLDYHALGDDYFSIHHGKGKIIGDYTFSQCNYCILPSMYLQLERNLMDDNEDLKECCSKYFNFVESKNESEKKRIAHRDISAQLSHMLGTTYHKIFDAISELKYVEGMESTYSMLNDNFEYMRRLINSIDDDFSSQSMKLEETAINGFMQEYCSAWKNYGKKQFAVSFESDLNDNTTFKIDEIFMKVMLDAILENANRHGFDGVNVEHPQIHILASYVMTNNIPCVLISIANNGAPFPNGFTIEQYIREGEFGGTKGRTGRGGYHVYQITKRHQGYINISSDDEWNVKINIMIPIVYYDECETEKFVKYGEECM